jgi:hypothetical protein
VLIDLFVSTQPQLDEVNPLGVAEEKAMDLFPIEALVSDLHPSAEGSNCWKLLNSEADCLSSGGKTKTVARPR